MFKVEDVFVHVFHTKSGGVDFDYLPLAFPT